MNEIIWIIMCFALMITAGVFLVVWTYRDAKNRGLNAKLWTLIVMFGSNGIGLLIYFLVGRKQSFTKCDKCDNRIVSDSKYCNKCGNLITNSKKIETKPTKHLIKGFIISFILSIVCFIGLIINMVNNDYIEFDGGNTSFSASAWTSGEGGSSWFLLETNTKNRWSVSYHKSTDKFSRIISKEENKPSLINIDASCNEGKLYIKLTQNDIEEVIDISNTNGPIEINLDSFKNGKIKLELIDDECKGVDVEVYWD